MSEPQKPQPPATPTLDLIGKYQSQLRALQAFLEWWNDRPRDEYGRRCGCCDRNDHTTFDVRRVMEQFSRDEYGIDPVKAEEERVALLEYQRALNVWRARRVPALHELDEHNETTGTVLWFCSGKCRSLARMILTGRYREGSDSLNAMPQEAECESCGRIITEDCLLIAPE